MKRNQVVLVDDNDVALGEMDKLDAHIKGHLHRAFSIFIFNEANELLLQQRSLTKYHGAGLWTNTCCSHPQWGEDLGEAASERLNYEMGMDCELQYLYSFVYKSEVENNLIEHELDHVFIGQCERFPKPNSLEVMDYRWVALTDLKMEMEQFPERFTVWFKLMMESALDRIWSRG